MCGIVGYVGPREARALLLQGLEQLEYRGYDSAGISVLAGDRIDAVRAVGNLSALRSALNGHAAPQEPSGGTMVAVADRPEPGTGIGHTRWATHGRVTEENAHPHYDTTDRVHIVVNGIVENYVELKDELVAAGAVFTSETDAEVIAHLVGQLLRRRPRVRRAQRLRPAARPLRVRGHDRRRARRAGRRSQGVPADHRSRGRRAVHRFGDPGVPQARPAMSSTWVTMRS